MRLCRLMFSLCLVLAGCTTPTTRDAGAEARGYERGYRQAVKEQYWLIQNQQRAAVPPAPNPRTP